MVKRRKEPVEELKESIWTDTDPSESIWTDHSTPALLQKVSQENENLVPGELLAHTVATAQAEGNQPLAPGEPGQQNDLESKRAELHRLINHLP